MSTVVEIEKAALRLPEEQRARLAGALLQSLHPPGDDSKEATDLEEAERREQEIETGRTHPLDEAEFWRRVEAARKT